MEDRMFIEKVHFSHSSSALICATGSPRCWYWYMDHGRVSTYYRSVANALRVMNYRAYTSVFDGQWARVIVVGGRGPQYGTKYVDIFWHWRWTEVLSLALSCCFFSNFSKLARLCLGKPRLKKTFQG